MNKLLRHSLTALFRSICYSNWVVLLLLFGGGASGLFAASENDLHSLGWEACCGHWRPLCMPGHCSSRSRSGNRWFLPIGRSDALHHL